MSLRVEINRKEIPVAGTYPDVIVVAGGRRYRLFEEQGRLKITVTDGRLAALSTGGVNTMDIMVLDSV